MPSGELVDVLRDISEELAGIRAELRTLPQRLRHQADLARCDALVGRVQAVRADELARLEERLDAVDIEPLRLVS